MADLLLGRPRTRSHPASRRDSDSDPGASGYAPVPLVPPPAPAATPPHRGATPDGQHAAEEGRGVPRGGDAPGATNGGGLAQEPGSAPPGAALSDMTGQFARMWDEFDRQVMQPMFVAEGAQRDGGARGGSGAGGRAGAAQGARQP